jgi:hypothetical protein
MNEHRKKAYRHLLYSGVLMIRSQTGFYSGKPGWRFWYWFLPRNFSVAYSAFFLADTLHNLAYFSSKDFEGFDEERFWRDVRTLDRLGLALHGENLRGMFQYALETDDNL